MIALLVIHVVIRCVYQLAPVIKNVPLTNAAFKETAFSPAVSTTTASLDTSVSIIDACTVVIRTRIVVPVKHAETIVAQIRAKKTHAALMLYVQSQTKEPRVRARKEWWRAQLPKLVVFDRRHLNVTRIVTVPREKPALVVIAGRFVLPIVDV